MAGSLEMVSRFLTGYGNPIISQDFDTASNIYPREMKMKYEIS